MTSNRALSRDIATLWFQAPFVIAVRMTQLSQSAMTGAPAGAEAARMVTEKALAAWESAIAMQFGFAVEAMRLAARAGQMTDTGATGRLAARGIRPYAKRVRSNRRRLGK